MLLYFSINLIKIGQLTYDINVTCKKSEGVIPEKMNYKPITVLVYSQPISPRERAGKFLIPLSSSWVGFHFSASDSQVHTGDTKAAKRERPYAQQRNKPST